jgi:hypothetical protein
MDVGICRRGCPAGDERAQSLLLSRVCSFHCVPEMSVTLDVVAVKSVLGAQLRASGRTSIDNCGKHCIMASSIRDITWLELLPLAEERMRSRGSRTSYKGRRRVWGIFCLEKDMLSIHATRFE